MKGHTHNNWGGIKKWRWHFFLRYSDSSLRMVISAAAARQFHRVCNVNCAKCHQIEQHWNWKVKRICFITFIFSTTSQCVIFDLFHFDACETFYFLHDENTVCVCVIHILQPNKIIIVQWNFEKHWNSPRRRMYNTLIQLSLHGY